MTDLRKAAEMALELLESKRLRMDEHLIPIVVDELRTALAKPEEISDYHEGWEEGFNAGLEKAQPEQEPVAWLDEEMDMAYTINEVADADGTDFIPLYTAPISEPVKERISEPDGNLEPVCDKDPQGCWCIRCQLGKVCKNAAPQGKLLIALTDEEIADVWANSKRDVFDFIIPFARAIEAKLGSKNYE